MSRVAKGRRLAGAFALLSCLPLSSCDKHTAERASAAVSAASAVASTAAAGSAPAKPPEKPWFAGTFSGNYRAEVGALKAEVGAPRQWQKDDGKAAVGPGTLSVSIAEDGAVEGSAEGAFGDETLSGRVEGDVVRATLLAKSDTSFRGTLIAAREGDGFKGSIQASSADSSTVRAASLELTRKP
jgi:hypothetical protein